MQVPDVRPGRLAVLSDAECWDLLRTAKVGRLAWSGAQGMSVIPVNFAIDDGTIVLRTTPYSMMARDCAGREVAFEVDRIDDEHHTGWSVLVRGRCDREHRASAAPIPWVTGPRTLGVRVEVTSLSGRRVLSPSEEEAHAV